jgi:hypothetical protein
MATDAVTIEGCAVVYGVPVAYDDVPRVVQPGACRASLTSGRHIHLLYTHERPTVLGCSQAGSLVFDERPDGLYFRAQMPAPLASDLGTTPLECSIQWLPRRSVTRLVDGVRVVDEMYLGHVALVPNRARCPGTWARRVNAPQNFPLAFPRNTL